MRKHACGGCSVAQWCGQRPRQGSSPPTSSSYLATSKSRSGRAVPSFASGSLTIKEKNLTANHTSMCPPFTIWVSLITDNEACYYDDWFIVNTADPVTVLTFLWAFSMEHLNHIVVRRGKKLVLETGAGVERRIILVGKPQWGPQPLSD